MKSHDMTIGKLEVLWLQQLHTAGSSLGEAAAVSRVFIPADVIALRLENILRNLTAGQLSESES